MNASDAARFFQGKNCTFKADGRACTKPPLLAVLARDGHTFMTCRIHLVLVVDIMQEDGLLHP